MSNATLNNAVFSQPTIPDMPGVAARLMHESTRRLYEAVKTLHGVTGQSAVARLLNISPQALKNWEERGVSRQGAITLQNVLGISTKYLDEGSGSMSIAAPVDERYPVPESKNRKVWVIGKGQGGLPERIWTDGDFPVGASNEYAEVASADHQAFLVPVVGDSMSPRYQHGEFALVEPGTDPDIEDDVLVRLVTGETMLKRLVSRRAGYRFGSYNDPAVLSYPPEAVAWVYYVAHPVPARKIKNRV